MRPGGGRARAARLRNRLAGVYGQQTFVAGPIEKSTQGVKTVPRGVRPLRIGAQQHAKIGGVYLRDRLAAYFHNRDRGADVRDLLGRERRGDDPGAAQPATQGKASRVVRNEPADEQRALGDSLRDARLALRGRIASFPDLRFRVEGGGAGGLRAMRLGIAERQRFRRKPLVSRRVEAARLVAVGPRHARCVNDKGKAAAFEIEEDRARPRRAPPPYCVDCLTGYPRRTLSGYLHCIFR